LDEGGALACWGLNFFGQLGNGGQLDSPVPVQATGLSERAERVSAGDGHSCALTATSQVECWGWAHFGQLGDGSHADRPRAGPVTDLGSARAVTAGGSHACALAGSSAGDATVKCWGANGFRQLGDGSTGGSSVPVAVRALSSAPRAVSAGAHHTCAVGGNNLVECWGANGNGQVGNGTIGGNSDVSPVPGLAEVVELDAGALHTCALGRTSGVACWGSNGSGQLGDGTRTDRPLPVTVAGLVDVTAVSAGGRHSCALTDGGEVLCWGANSAGQLGNGTLLDSPEPVSVEGLSDAVAVDAGSRHTCAVRSGGELVCWGANDWGQLGDGTRVGRLRPTEVAGLSAKVEALALGAEHTCAVLTTGVVECFGFNFFGQLGDGRAPFSGSRTPVAVVGFEPDQPT
jgi:alpha-tubulin suppressor-like RCC1 family protein